MCNLSFRAKVKQEEEKIRSYECVLISTNQPAAGMVAIARCCINSNLRKSNHRAILPNRNTTTIRIRPRAESHLRMRIRMDNRNNTDPNSNAASHACVRSS
jgi:hypothetical protein